MAAGFAPPLAGSGGDAERGDRRRGRQPARASPHPDLLWWGALVVTTQADRRRFGSGAIALEPDVSPTAGSARNGARAPCTRHGCRASRSPRPRGCRCSAPSQAGEGALERARGAGAQLVPARGVLERDDEAHALAGLEVPALEVKRVATRRCAGAAAGAPGLSPRTRARAPARRRARTRAVASSRSRLSHRDALPLPREAVRFPDRLAARPGLGLGSERVGEREAADARSSSNVGGDGRRRRTVIVVLGLMGAGALGATAASGAAGGGGAPMAACAPSPPPWLTSRTPQVPYGPHRQERSRATQAHRCGGRST